MNRKNMEIRVVPKKTNYFLEKPFFDFIFWLFGIYYASTNC